MLAPVVGITNMTLFDEIKIKEKYGLKPKQIIDYKALVGDASDNYPGVSGIGPKTASDLLSKYETLENLYLHITDLPINLQEKLATIILDAPVKLNEEECLISRLDTKGLKKQFEVLNFNSLLKRLAQLEQKPKVKIKGEKNDDSQMSLL